MDRAGCIECEESMTIVYLSGVLFSRPLSVGQTRSLIVIFLGAREAKLLYPRDSKIPREGVTGQQNWTIQTVCLICLWV